MAGLATGALTAALLAACWHMQSVSTQRRQSSCASPRTPAQPEAGHHDLKDTIVQEHLARNVQFFGEQAMADIMSSYVVVVGLGGVGSHAAHHLLRSGVGRLLLIDFDQVRMPCGPQALSSARSAYTLKPANTCRTWNVLLTVNAQAHHGVKCSRPGSGDTVVAQPPRRRHSRGCGPVKGHSARQALCEHLPRGPSGSEGCHVHRCNGGVDPRWGRQA
jgi:ThiF family